MNDCKSPKDIQALKEVRNVVEKKFDYLLEIDSSHTRRAATIFGFGGVILSIAFSLYPSGRTFIPLFLLGALVIFVSLFLLVLAMLSRKLQIEPHPWVFSNENVNRKYEEVLLWLISQFRGGYRYNKKVIMRKAVVVDVGIICMFVGLLFVALSIFVN
ncbi:hypothetical protein ES703_81446 [subsurface metagenome]